MGSLLPRSAYRLGATPAGGRPAGAESDAPVGPAAADAWALWAEGRRLLAEAERLRAELAGGTVDLAAHRRLRARLRAHRAALQRRRDGRARASGEVQRDDPGGGAP